MRLDGLLIALTRDFVQQLKDVLVTEKPIHMGYLEMKTMIDGAKGALKVWEDQYSAMYTVLVEKWQKEEITPPAGFAASRERVKTTMADFRKRLTEVYDFYDNHVKLEKAIERVMGRASGLSGSVDVVAKLKEQFEIMQQVDWLSELGDVVDQDQMQRDDDEDEAPSLWSVAVDRYETHVAKVEDVLNGELKKLVTARRNPHHNMISKNIADRLLVCVAGRVRWRRCYVPRFQEGQRSVCPSRYP